MLLILKISFSDKYGITVIYFIIKQFKLKKHKIRWVGNFFGLVATMLQYQNILVARTRFMFNKKKK